MYNIYVVIHKTYKREQIFKKGGIGHEYNEKSSSDGFEYWNDIYNE